MRKTHEVKITGLAANWRAYFTSKPSLYNMDPKGEGTCVRFLPAGFAGV